MATRLLWNRKSPTSVKTCLSYESKKLLVGKKILSAALISAAANQGSLPLLLPPCPWLPLPSRWAPVTAEPLWMTRTPIHLPSVAISAPYRPASHLKESRRRLQMGTSVRHQPTLCVRRRRYKEDKNKNSETTVKSRVLFL